MWSRHRILSRLAVGALGAALLTVIPVSVPEADACWCRANNRLPERIATAEHVFKFRVEELVPRDARNAVAYGDVVEVLKGEVQSRVRVGLKLQKTCVDLDQLVQGSVLGVIGRKGAYKANGACDEPESDRAIAQVFEPIAQPPPFEGELAFLAGHDRLGARVAVYDDRLQIAYLAPGGGSTIRMAVCPDGLRSIEIVSDGERETPLTAEVRNLETLEIAEAFSIGRTKRDMGDMRDLVCHDPTGNSFSYLAVRAREPDVPREVARRASFVELWEAGEVNRIAAADAREVAVDIESGLAYTIVQGPEPAVERWRFGEDERDRKFDLPDLRLADLAFDPADGSVVVIGSPPLEDRKKVHGKGVFVRIEDDEVTVHEIPQALRPDLIQIVEGSIYTAVDIRGKGEAYQLRGPKGKVLDEFRVGSTFRPALAASGGLLLARSGSSEIRLDGQADGFPVLRTTTKALAALPADGNLTISIEALPPLETRSGVIVDGGPTRPSLRVTTPISPQRSYTVPIALGVLTVLGMLAVLLFRRRRRAPDDDGWMG